MKEKILITGATGLIGSRLVSLLHLTGKYEVIRICRDRNLENAIHIDLNGDWSINQLPDRVDSIIHLAQSDDFRSFPEKAGDIFMVNTTSTSKLLDYARRKEVGKFLYASTGGVYGAGLEPKKESELINPRDLNFYSNTKYCSEILVQNYSHLFSTTILRFFFVYGEGQKNSMLIPRLIDSVRASKPIQLQGKNGIRINPVYVEDACNAIMNCLKQPGNKILNVAGKEVFNLRQIVHLIGNLVGQKPVLNIDNTHSQNLIADISELNKKYGAPLFSLEEGLRKIINQNGK